MVYWPLNIRSSQSRKLHVVPLPPTPSWRNVKNKIKSSFGLAVTTHLHLVPWLRMPGALSSLTISSAWLGDYVSTRDFVLLCLISPYFNSPHFTLPDITLPSRALLVVRKMRDPVNTLVARTSTYLYNLEVTWKERWLHISRTVSSHSDG
jgi:hypothetical protein